MQHPASCSVHLSSCYAGSWRSSRQPLEPQSAGTAHSSAGEQSKEERQGTDEPSNRQDFPVAVAFFSTSIVHCAWGTLGLASAVGCCSPTQMRSCKICGSMVIPTLALRLHKVHSNQQVRLRARQDQALGMPRFTCLAQAGWTPPKQTSQVRLALRGGARSARP